MSKRFKATMVFVLTLTLYLSGCGLFGEDEKKKLDPPEEVSQLEEGESVETSDSTDDDSVTSSMDESSEKVMTELYLIDENGYVVSQTLPLPKTESVAKQAVEHLVTNGPVSNILPNGFRAVLPADTTVDVNIKTEDKMAVVDFSTEFGNYEAEDEEKILQAVTWTLTQFENVEKVEFRVNGYPLTEMPVNGTKISPDGLSRSMGINIDPEGVIDISNSRQLTVYYLAQNEGSMYYVPVTKRVSNIEGSNINAVVAELIKGPSYSSNLVSEFFPDVELLDTPTVKDGEVTLNFNEAIYGSFEEKMISTELLNSLVLSLTEQTNIKKVSVLVNGEGEIVNEQGESLSEPVTRPEKVNTVSF
ncbi:GerMN domain-containing protein [Bacillus spongiae]|uniref:GerMN domain-containing protein n=1 Tax=Bacillus spongiae TaxID=2683610 RepID=A0ABU8H8S9_9BACI